MPNLMVLRPADANEATILTKFAFNQKQTPSLVLLTRQGLPVINREKYPKAESVLKGGYVIDDSENPEIIIFATGSEVSLAIEAKKLLPDLSIRVVNLACWELFDQQSEEYKLKTVGPNSAFKVSIEAGITFGWEKYTGRNGLNIGINRFGESAPGEILAEYFGFTPEKIANKIKKQFHK